MTLTLEIPEAVLAAIWEDTWGDKDPRTLNERCLHLLEDAAMRYHQAWPGRDKSAMLAQFQAEMETAKRKASP